jgi:hypothetical protein
MPHPSLPHEVTARPHPPRTLGGDLLIIAAIAALAWYALYLIGAAIWSVI